MPQSIKACLPTESGIAVVLSPVEGLEIPEDAEVTCSISGSRALVSAGNASLLLDEGMMRHLLSLESTIFLYAEGADTQLATFLGTLFLPRERLVEVNGVLKYLASQAAEPSSVAA